MKNLTFILFVALFATIYTKATFQLFSHSGSWCDYETKLGKVNIQVRQKGLSSSEKHFFNMTLLDSHGGEFDAMCTIEAISGEAEKENEDEKKEDEKKEDDLEDEKELTDEDETNTKETQEKEDQAEGKEDQAEDKEQQTEDKDDQLEEKKESESINHVQIDGRRLQEEAYYPYSYCLFTPTKHDGDLKFKTDSISTKEDIQIEVEDDFHVIAQKCLSENEAKDAANINLSFRQINGFKCLNGELSFNFYGITTQSFTSIEIRFFIYLFFNGKLENELKEAICSQNQGVQLTDNKPVQVALDCKISNLEKQYSSFVLFESEEVSGVPYDNDVLLDPVKTEEAIQAGDLVDFSKEENQVVPPIFTPSSIESSKCSENGKFTITGQFDSEFEGGKEVKFPLLFPAGEISCNFPSAQANQDVTIECKFVGKEMEQFIILGQQTIMKNEKEELLVMKGISSTDKIKCINGEVGGAESKKNLGISFRQINHFLYQNQQIKFDFFGLASQSLEINYEFIFYIFLISGGVKETSLKEAKCVLGEGVTL